MQLYASSFDHSRIWEVQSGILLVDRSDQIQNWIPEDGQFDALIASEGELSADVTIPHLAVLDNFRYSSDPSDACPAGGSFVSTAGIRLFSNPLTRDGALSWNSEASGAVTLRLCDSQGRSIVHREFNSKKGGLREIRWGAFVGDRSLPSGVYFLSIEGASRDFAAQRIMIVE